jgi:nicotinamidase-related amidase
MSALAGTGLLAWLGERGITRVVLAGASTHLVVAATAFAASDAGLDVDDVRLTMSCSPARARLLTVELQQAGLAICAALGRVVE